MYLFLSFPYPKNDFPYSKTKSPYPFFHFPYLKMNIHFWLCAEFFIPLYKSYER